MKNKILTGIFFITLVVSLLTGCGNNKETGEPVSDNEAGIKQETALNETIESTEPNVDEVTMAIDFEKLQLFGRPFHKWTYESFVNYMMNSDFVEYPQPGSTPLYQLFKGDSNEILAHATIAPYRDATAAKEVYIDTEGLYFTLSDKADNSVITWSVMRLPGLLSVPTDSPLHDILGTSLKEFIDTHYGENAFDDALSAGKVKQYGKSFLSVSAENTVSFGAGEENCSLIADADGNIERIFYSYRGEVEEFVIYNEQAVPTVGQNIADFVNDVRTNLYDEWMATKGKIYEVSHIRCAYDYYNGKFEYQIFIDTDYDTLPDVFHNLVVEDGIITEVVKN